MRNILIAIFSAIVLLTIAYYWRHPLGTKVIINGQTIKVELAISEAEKQKGLGYRDFLPKDSGMLFVYENKDRYSFWMKGMRFPLDYIWIDGNTIVDLSENIPAPSSYDEQPVHLSPNVPVNKILEVNAGIIERLGIHIGETIQFTN